MRSLILITVLSFTIVSCNSDKMKMKTKKTDSDTLSLYIDNIPNFGYNFSTEPILYQNDYYKSFYEIDKDIFNFLKSNSSTETYCKVYIQNSYTDKYGNEKSKYNEYNTISLLELKKYKESTFWTDNTCGIKFIKYGKCKYLD